MQFGKKRIKPSNFPIEFLSLVVVLGPLGGTAEKPGGKQRRQTSTHSIGRDRSTRLKALFVVEEETMQRDTTPYGLVFVFAFVIFLLVVLPAFADIYMVQKTYESRKYREDKPIISDSIIRTWIAEGKLRQDYGDPVTFIHITRLDRRPGELISYLLNLGAGSFGNTYWTFCRPYVPPLPQTTSGNREKARSEAENTSSTNLTRLLEGLAVVDSGETKFIKNFHCRKYLLKGRLNSTELKSDIWVTMDIVPVLEQYGLIWSVRIEHSDSKVRFREFSDSAPSEMEVLKGFPIHVTEIEQNPYVYYERRLELLEFKEEPAPPNYWDLPKGLTKKYRGAMANPPRCED